MQIKVQKLQTEFEGGGGVLEQVGKQEGNMKW